MNVLAREGTVIVFVLLGGGLPVPSVGRKLERVANDIPLHVLGGIPQVAPNALGIVGPMGNGHDRNVGIKMNLSSLGARRATRIFEGHVFFVGVTGTGRAGRSEGRVHGLSRPQRAQCLKDRIGGSVASDATTSRGVVSGGRSWRIPFVNLLEWDLLGFDISQQGSVGMVIRRVVQCR